MRRAAFTEQDVLIDLGSGLGHVPLLVSICAGIRAVGVEIEPAYIASARKCANELNLGHVTFLPSDARQAGLSSGTVFYLYTPFTGTILRAVLERLRQEAASRAMRVCSFGPCTATIAQEPWLKALGPCETGRIAVFSSQF
jgi:predicted RNA methylase